MKKHALSLISIFLALMVSAGCASGGSPAASSTASQPASSSAPQAASSSSTDAAPEIPEQTAPVKYYCRTNAERESMPANQEVLAYIEEQTGIKLEINAIAQESFKEKIDLMIAANEEFDGMNLVGYGSTYAELAQKKAIIPINSLLDQYGPNVKRVMDAGLYTTTDQDGNIWSIPRAEQFPEGYVPTIRRDWLNQLGMEMPSTIEELEAYFEAVKTTDLNGNGQNDEIPYLPNMLLYGISNFVPYFLPVRDGNLNSTGFSDLSNTKNMRYMDESGIIRPIFSHPDFINLIAKFREWYEKGYMPKDIHLLKTAQLTDIRTTGVAGALGGWYSDGNSPILKYNEANPDKKAAYYEPIPPLQNAPSGRSVWPSNPANAPQIMFMGTGKNTVHLMRYFDWICANPQNTATVQFGLEGEHWNWVEGEQNTIEVTETGSQQYKEFYALANLYWDGLMPKIKVSQDNPSQYMREQQMQAIRGFEMNYPFDAHIPYDYDGTEAEYLTADGGTLMEEAIIKMVIGETPLSDWDSILATYNSIEGDILSAVWTEQYNAFAG